MSMLSLIFLSTFMLPPAAADGDSLLLNRSKQQAEYYMSQIEKKRNPVMNLWALSTLCGTRSEVKAYINARSRSEQGSSLPLRPFCAENSYKALIKKLAFEIQSPDLLIAALIAEPETVSKKQLYDAYAERVGFPGNARINYGELASRIIQGQPIAGILPDAPFKFIHLLLFFHAPFLQNGTVPVEYVKQASASWLTSHPSFVYPSLKNSLFTATLMGALYITDDYSDTEPLYTKLIRDKLFPISNIGIKMYRALDYSMYRLGYFDRSLEISRTFSVPLARFLNDRRSELTALMAQGAYLLQIGKIEEAQKINLKILEQVNKYNINISKAILYNNLGITYERSGNFDKYIELLYKALEIAQGQQNYDFQLNILNNLYIYYRRNNNPQTAIRYLKEAKDLAESHGNQEDTGLIYTYFGTFYRKFKQNFEIAQEYFIQAESILDPENNFDLYMDLLSEKGKLYEEIGSYNSALHTYDKIISLSRNKSVTHLFETLVDKAAVYLKLNELKKASQYITKINSHEFNQFDFQDIIKAQTVQAGYLIKTGQPDKAYALLKPVIQHTVEWAKNTTDLQSGFWNVEQEFLDAFQLTADLLIETGRAGEAVEVLDRLKTINDASLYQNPMVKSSLLNESELSRYRRLTNQLNALRKRHLAASRKDRPALQTRIDRLSAQKRALDRKITRLADREPVNVDEIQRNLSAYEAVLHVTELGGRYYIATIFRNDIRFRKLKLDPALRSAFSTTIENLASGETDLNNLYHISETLAIQNLPARIKKLTIVPDSYLYRLPVGILPVRKPEFSYSYGEARYLIERFGIHYLTSLSDFNAPSDDRRRDYTWDFAGYGVSDFHSYTRRNLAPLPFARDEVSTILAGLTHVSDKTMLLDSSSTEAAFKATAPDARILHLATHSTVSRQDPLFSTIFMSRGDSTAGGDFPGRVFAYELFELNLANDLIMLNSCDSGSGSYLQGAGIMGISRALRYAGANSLVLNVWSVNDMMASEFAVQFYKNLNQGASKAEALRAAKLHMLKNNNANPHYWGTYMLIGKDDAVIKPFEKTNIYVASSFMLYFIILVTITLIKKNRRKQIAS